MLSKFGLKALRSLSSAPSHQAVFWLAGVGTLNRGFATSGRRFEAPDNSSKWTNILTENKGRVEVVSLNRPKAYNALSNELMSELGQRMLELDQDDNIGAIVLTGSGKAFAAGADIKQMKDTNYADNYRTNFLDHWNQMTKVRKPILAAVNGMALGGGCEVAMMCDIIYAAPSCVFGQPEIKLGIIPGAGGTQRLTHAVGKSRAMEIILTGGQLTAEEALACGLISKVSESPLEDAIKTANKIAEMSLPSVMMAKECVNAAFETPLAEGLRLERRLFQSLFSLADQKEGMSAFAEKRKANFQHR